MKLKIKEDGSAVGITPYSGPVQGKETIKNFGYQEYEPENSNKTLKLKVPPIELKRKFPKVYDYASKKIANQDSSPTSYVTNKVNVFREDDEDIQETLNPFKKFQAIKRARNIKNIRTQKTADESIARNLYLQDNLHNKDVIAWDDLSPSEKFKYIFVSKKIRNYNKWKLQNPGKKLSMRDAMNLPEFA